MITTIAIVLVGSFTAVLGYSVGRRANVVDVETAALKMSRANRDAGRLARRIGKQRLQIRKLKADVQRLAAANGATKPVALGQHMAH